MEAPSDDDLEPFLSEALNESLPPRWRLGGLLYLEMRETFLSDEQRKTLANAREQICRALAATLDPEIPPEPERPAPRRQGTLFSD